LHEKFIDTQKATIGNDRNRQCPSAPQQFSSDFEIDE
jgi:hypothetical protein